MTSKQEAHKLKVSIIGLFNPNMRHVLRQDRLIQEFVIQHILVDE